MTSRCLRGERTAFRAASLPGHYVTFTDAGRARGKRPAGWPRWPGRRGRPGRSRTRYGQVARRTALGHQLGGRAAGAAQHVVPPLLRRRGGRVHRPAGRLGQQVRPGPRDDLDQRVPAAAGQQPAAACCLVGELVDGGVRGPLPVNGQLEVRQRVEPVGVAAVLADQDLRVKGAQQRRDHGMEGPQPGRVAGAARQGDVHGPPLGAGPARLRWPAGAGEQQVRGLVQADREHPRVVVEGGLHAVAVMHVDVHVGDPLGALAQQPGDRDGRVVVDAEAAGTGPHRMMQSAADAGPVLRRAVLHRPGGGQRRARHQGRCLVHAGEHRVVRGAETEGQGRADVGAGAPHGGQVARIVDQFQLGVGGRLGTLHRQPGQHVQVAGQFHGQLDPHRRQRVARAEVVGRQPVVPGQVHAAGHGPILPGRG